MNSDPYARLVAAIRREGASYNEAGVETGLVTADGAIIVDGTRISRNIKKLRGVSPAAGDTVAVKRMSGMNLIIGVVDEG